jgi:hypothetical protein
MSKTKICLLLFCFLFTSTAVSGQNISLNASVDKNKLSMSEQLVLKVKVSGDLSSLPEPALPSLPGFTAYSSGRKQSVSIVNGKVSSSIDYNYILVPKSPGQHTIEQISLNHKGKIYRTSPIVVEVVQSQPQVPKGQPQPQTQPAQAPGTDPPGQDKVFITANVDKKKVYVGEQITLSFKFYQGVRLLSQPRYGPPDTTGFWAEDLPPQQQYYADISGRRYAVTEIKTALFPTAPGKYTVGTAQLKCSVGDFSRDNDFLRSFFSSGKTKLLKTDPITIAVIALPGENRPPDFTGTIGNYQIKAKVDKKEVKVNEPVTLEVTVSGKGNIKTINEPALEELKGFKKYETLSSLNISKEDYKVHGSKSFKTVLVPKVTGKQVIPSITYSYFDPEAKIYKSIKTAPISLNALPGPKEEPKIFTPEGIRLIGTDIRYIKSGKLDLSRKKRLIYKGPFFITAQFLPVLCLMLTWGYKLRTERLTRDIGYARFTRAYKSAKKGLKQSLKLIYPDKAKQFYDSLANTFTEYLANKLNLSQAGLTLNLLVEELASRNVNSELVDRIKNIWQEYDFARFAPSSRSDRKSMENIYRNTEELINQFEKFI